MKARIKFRKYGALRFIGHLDVMRFFQKVMRRADIPIAFTGGYSPHMIMSFASPLGIGLSSDGEYFDIELREAVNSADAVRRMNEACVEGIEVVSMKQIAEEKKMTGMTILAGADYLVSLKKGTLPHDWKDSFTAFMEQPEIRIVKQTKRSEKEVDIRPLIDRWEIRGEDIFLQLAAGSSQNLKPDLVMEAFCRYLGVSCDDTAFGYHRLEIAGQHLLGNVYVGRVKNIVPNIGAAFVEIESGVNCYYDMKDAEHAVFTRKSGKKPLCIGDELVVQISKEAVKTKAPTVTGNISFTGRYAVLTHGNTRIGVSSKIPKKLREEYKGRLKEFQNDRFGIIVRTNAKDAPFQDVLDEIMRLRGEYERIMSIAPTRVCFSCLRSAP